MPYSEVIDESQKILNWALSEINTDLLDLWKQFTDSTEQNSSKITVLLVEMCKLQSTLETAVREIKTGTSNDSVVRDNKLLTASLLDVFGVPGFSEVVGAPTILPARGANKEFEKALKPFMPKIIISTILAKKTEDAYDFISFYQKTENYRELKNKEPKTPVELLCYLLVTEDVTTLPTDKIKAINVDKMEFPEKIKQELKNAIAVYSAATPFFKTKKEIVQQSKEELKSDSKKIWDAIRKVGNSYYNMQGANFSYCLYDDPQPENPNFTRQIIRCYELTLLNAARNNLIDAFPDPIFTENIRAKFYLFEKATKNNALHYAVHHKNIEMVKLLLNNFPALINGVNDKNNEGNTFLDLAYQSSSPEIAELFFKKTNPDLKSAEYLYFIVEDNRIDKVKNFLVNTAVKNIAAAIKKYSLLDLAIRNNNPAMIGLLLQNGADAFREGKYGKGSGPFFSALEDKKTTS